MPRLQNRSYDFSRDRLGDASASVLAERGFLVSSKSHVADWRRTAFVEAWAELRPRAGFALQSLITNLAVAPPFDTDPPARLSST